MPRDGKLARALARTPYFSLGLFVLLTLIFVVELRAGPYGAGGKIAFTTLTAVGAVSRTLVFSGEWWRLFTAPLLHGSWEHLISNGLVLILDGYFLESLIGRRWYAATFSLGAVAGAIASISLNDPNIVSVGASGGIMALLGATFVCSFADAADEKRAKKMRRLSLRLLLPSLIPLAAQVDTNAHLGGVAAGGCIGFFLQIVWTEGKDRPEHAGIAGWASGICASLAAIAFGLVSLHFAHYAAMVHADPETAPAYPMIPNDQLRDSPLALIDRSDDFVRNYPHDPRAHLYHAMRFRIQGDLTDSEEELREALAMNGGSNAELAKFLDLELALVLLQEGRAPEAKAVGGPACDYLNTLEDEGGDSSDADALRGGGVCG